MPNFLLFFKIILVKLILDDLQNIFQGVKGNELSSFLFKNWVSSSSKRYISKDNLLISTENMLVFSDYNNSITIVKPDEYPDQSILYLGSNISFLNQRKL